jgi:ATP-dependent exoDNAse (exonuclease V) beta subunit
VLEWRKQSKTASIAVLCRRNTQAMKVQGEILRRGGKCDLLVGGAFYTSEAVRELRAFLEATLDPSDDAAVLEVCETRWASALLTQSSAGSDPAGDQARVKGWLSRLPGLGRDGNLDRSDLRGVRNRLADLRDMLLQMSALAFIVEAKRLLSPHLCKRDSDQDGTREQYARNLNHLVTIMDLHFADSSATADAVLAWLRLQIATNRNEDEPRDGVAVEGVTQAITVHKAKGLEFDRVVIPFTGTPFEPPKAVKTHVFVSGEGAPSRVRWRWSAGRPAIEIQNASNADGAWRQDEQETDHEETRLLYVAMTRARNRLTIIRANRANPAQRTWDGLLARGQPE